MWNLPAPGIELISPALAGGFLSTAPPGKSWICIWTCIVVFEHWIFQYQVPLVFLWHSILWVGSGNKSTLQLFLHCQHSTLIRLDSSQHTSSNSFEIVLPLQAFCNLKWFDLTIFQLYDIVKSDTHSVEIILWILIFSLASDKQ